MKNTKIFLIVVLVAAACGDDAAKKPDAAVQHDSTPPIDAFVAPAPPTLGAQIDRMGRPAINTALNHAFDPNDTTKNAAKDAYNQDGATGSWQATYIGEFMKNLAVLDALDTGLQGGPNPPAPGDGCRNQVGYDGTLNMGGAASATSYQTTAGLLADDQLYVNTAKTTCHTYLGVEISVLSGGLDAGCGGRAPSYDVMDFSYSALASVNLISKDGMFTPLFSDGVAAHTDGVGDSTFPFLATPH